jgi:molecular chaperone DnaJ
MSTGPMTDRDFYEILGLSRGASADEIKRAYKRLAREHHPDLNPGDEQAEARFKEIALAYETLSDPTRRQRYDTFGHAAGTGQGGGDPFGGGFGDIFEAFFSGGSPFGGSSRGPTGPPRGPDLEAVVDLDFEEMVFGSQSEVTVRTAVACEDCAATGAAEGTRPETCADCGGLGQVRQVRQSILCQMVTTGPCPRCSGLGQVIAEPCRTCGGEGREVTERTFTLNVPAGVDPDKVLRLAGRGAVGPRGGPPGDLYVRVRVRRHPHLERRGFDLYHELHLPVTQAALGARLPYETLQGTEELEIPAGTQTGQVFRLQGHGVPKGRANRRGDLLVQVVVDTPEVASDEEQELLRRLAELRGEEVEPPAEGFLSRIRSAFS